MSLQKNFASATTKVLYYLFVATASILLFVFAANVERTALNYNAKVQKITESAKCFNYFLKQT